MEGCMSFLGNKGNPTSPVWILIDRPLSGDEDKGYLFSSPIGYVWDKMLQEAGIKDYYVTGYRRDTDNLKGWSNVAGDLEHYRPPIIIPLGHTGKQLLTCMNPKYLKKKGSYDTANEESEISKYSGSILTSPHLNYPHYIIPTEHPVDIIKQWKMRDIVINCDLAKAASELDYWKSHACTLQPLPEMEAKIDFESLDELLAIIDGMRDKEYVSCDIETVYPRAPTKTQPSQFYKILPGYPITVGLATSTTAGISFDMFRESNVETRELWKKLAVLLRDTPQVGQNYFNFDANFFEMLGFKIPLEKCRDTMIMHHLLWAELPHKLQFLARQYTRHPYWKDEGAGWSPKNMRGMKIYNVKDVCVTLEIFHKEREEIIQRELE
jgi:hypothetical protein